MPVAAKHTTRLIRLLENPNDFWFARKRLHVGQPHQRPEGAREGFELIERKVLVPEEQHLMAGERTPELFCQIVGNRLAQVYLGNLGTNGASQSMLFHDGSHSGFNGSLMLRPA